MTRASRTLRARPADDGDGQAGQAAVELVAVLPVVLAVVLAAASVLSAGAASEAAGAAAHAGAAAILQEGDPAAAAKQALGDSAGARAEVAVRERRVTVTVRPDGLPAPLARWLTARETADAGPGPAPPASTTVIRGGDGAGSRPSGKEGRR